MKEKLSRQVLGWLIDEKQIASSDQELYRYAIFCFFWGLIPIIFAFLAGIMFNVVKESILMMFTFGGIRKFSGGYHLKSPRSCIITSAILIIIFCVVLHMLRGVKNSTVVTITLIIACSILFIFSPVDSKERQLTEKEIKAFRRLARWGVCTLLFIYSILLGLLLRHIAIPIGMGAIMAAFLQVPSLLCRVINKLKKR